ncbi:uncharacterized protein PHACADRAFT_203318 [Phanerochaete carnosa HHB-10118-sp]|uniref:Uncharacterized protein n=1 Tax=Phanerochaete carnosa (strain HHB-10118-sp) TaxID=650164 RepID=K5VMX6_PHACS|nr:uncharacterized protein PHACADRAFT_203318 [Phanerochaete carnosa HHB-10118-sp]EKM48050.1 hypothetical protein PHACADRAFT_203318 [Phanerochaete carnosa HHB-10118-sp]
MPHTDFEARSIEDNLSFPLVYVLVGILQNVIDVSSSGSGSGIDPSERSILGDTLVSLPGIQELFGVSSLSSAQPSSYVVSL